jgi:hypothetical protein
MIDSLLVSLNCFIQKKNFDFTFSLTNITVQSTNVHIAALEIIVAQILYGNITKYNC